VAKPEMMKNMQERMPGAKRVAIQGVGHGINMLAPEACAREIRSFIEAHGEAA
jgi:pimeloyl-ACP methyl ester carboxylesterase